MTTKPVTDAEVDRFQKVQSLAGLEDAMDDLLQSRAVEAVGAVPDEEIGAAWDADRNAMQHDPRSPREAFWAGALFVLSRTAPPSTAPKAQNDLAVADSGGVQKLWLWKNFVDGRPEYWAFDNPYPIHLDHGDPQTLGEPCGYAIVKPSRQGRTDVSEAEVLRNIARAQGKV